MILVDPRRALVYIVWDKTADLVTQWRNQMPLFLLERKGSTGYDETRAVVVRAENAQRARRVAAQEVGVSDKDVFLSAKTSSCKFLFQEGKEELIIKDFQAG